MTKEEIKDELYRMLSDVVNGGYPKRNNNQKDRYREAVKKAIEALEHSEKNVVAVKWIIASERLPEKGGDYFVTQKAVFPEHVYRSIASYAPNLYDVNEYEFKDKKRPGWYEYDSEWGYYEVDGVIAWMPLPEPYKEVQE